MTLKTIFENDDHFEDELKRAEENWREAGNVLAALTRKARQDDDAARGLKTALADYQGGYKIAVTERSRVADERRRETGANGSYAVDFDAARTEIGRRLALLRAARDG